MNKDIVVLIPVYDPDEEIMLKFLDELKKEFKNIVFVDDGCSSKHHKFMKDLSKDYPVIKHAINLGKGRGLKNGINYILNNYDKGKAIVTADCDGQHSVKDIVRCGNFALDNPNKLVLGVRDFDSSNVPFKSRYGNVLTRNTMALLVGPKISDTQTGLRAMSYDVAKELMDVSGERYEYETNVFIATKKRNIDILEVIIDTIYINDNGTSHFNPVKDSIRIYKLFLPYILVVMFAYILENVFIYYSYHLAFIPLIVLCAKLISAIIIRSCNKHLNLIYTLINYVVDVIVLLVFSKLYILFKILADILMFISYMLLNKVKPKRK